MYLQITHTADSLQCHCINNQRFCPCYTTVLVFPFTVHLPALRSVCKGSVVEAEMFIKYTYLRSDILMVLHKASPYYDLIGCNAHM